MSSGHGHLTMVTWSLMSSGHLVIETNIRGREPPDSRNQMEILFPALLLTEHLTLSKWPHMSGPPSPHLGESCFPESQGLTATMFWKQL